MLEVKVPSQKSGNRYQEIVLLWLRFLDWESSPCVPEAEALGSWYGEKPQSGCLEIAAHRPRDCAWTRSLARTGDGSTCRKSGLWSWVTCSYGEPELKLPPDGVTVPDQWDKENTCRRVKVFNPVGKSKAPQSNTCLGKDRETETETQKIATNECVHTQGTLGNRAIWEALRVTMVVTSPSDNKGSSHVETFFVKSSWWKNHSTRICWVPAVPARALDAGDTGNRQKAYSLSCGNYSLVLERDELHVRCYRR